MHENYYGNNMKWFTGIVREILDESSVRVRIFGIHNMADTVKVPDSDLPKAVVILPTTGSQAGGGAPGHNLSVDSWVVGWFADPQYCQQPIIIGVVQGSDYSMSNSAGGGEFTAGGQSGDNPNVDIDQTSNIPGNSNTAKAYNYIYAKLQAEGAQNIHILASAAVGVLLLETSGINPAEGGGYKGRAWGICQWLGPRKAQLFNKFGPTKKLEDQLDFMWWELNNTESGAKRKWLSATTLPDAVAGFCMFERAEEYNLRTRQIMRNHGNFKKRLQYAYRTMNSIKYGGGGGTSTPSASPSPAVGARAAGA